MITVLKIIYGMIPIQEGEDHMARRSMQREAVYANLCSRTDHPTAEEVYASLKPKMPSISLATVYRNLHTLTEQGKIQTISIDKSDHFDAKVEQHYHL